ncbi:hypothetical protein [Ureibacillus thermosphaericus]|uniref:hypothetical protein n=1 Tax=Ureibacillus thermosphaericus TaxID=51173 RepID=UPI000BBBF897|nr:hypothetical protein [Ureibacillus thermosphaericus]
MEIFEELRLQVFDKNRWNDKVFFVFGYEAGLGKSRKVQQFLAEVEDKSLYVQKFEKDGELDTTVERMNSLAGKRVAERFAGDDTKSKKARKKAIEAKVLCITHKMYSQICKGLHKDLIEGA